MDGRTGWDTLYRFLYPGHCFKIYTRGAHGVVTTANAVFYIVRWADGKTEVCSTAPTRGDGTKTYNKILLVDGLAYIPESE
jgi:hypothetical protein